MKIPWAVGRSFTFWDLNPHIRKTRWWDSRVTSSSEASIYIFILNVSIASAKDWHLPSAFTRRKSLATAVADLQHILKRVQGGNWEMTPLCCGKPRNRLSTFLGRDFRAQILHFLTFRRSLDHERRHCCLWPATTFCHSVCLTAWIPFTKTTYMLTLPHLFRAAPRAIWEAVFRLEFSFCLK